MRKSIAAATVLLVAGCVAPRQPSPAPAPVPVAPRPAPAPVPIAADWRDRAYTPGDWSYGRSEAGSEAHYGALSLICDARGGQVSLVWTGVDAGTLTVRTSYGDSIRTTKRSNGGLRIALGGREPLLDQIAYSRGRFMLAAGGQELILPAWPELQRVVEDCRP